MSTIVDPVDAFIEAACVPRDGGHASGTLDEAQRILSRHPHVAKANVYTAAILADEATVQDHCRQDPGSARARGGPRDWDALTYLCFSRYLRLDPGRSEAFVRTARVLLDAGANAQTGWFETIDHPNPRQILESALYGAAGIAHHAELTRLLLERGADPNDEETPYHAPEGYDNAAMQVLLESGKLTEASLVWMLVRKADWHDYEGMRLLLGYGADPNAFLRFGNNALQHAIQRDNHWRNIELLLDGGVNPALTNARDGRSAVAMAARRGRGDLLELLEKRAVSLELEGADRLIAICARGDRQGVSDLAAREPQLVMEVLAEGGALLAQFAGNGNVEGLGCLLDLGVNVNAPNKAGDPYFDLTKDSTALHAAAWRAWPRAVQLLIERGAAVNVHDAKGRTPLALAVKACVDSYWTERRSPDSVEALLRAGAKIDGIAIPSGYSPVDELLRSHLGSRRA